MKKIFLSMIVATGIFAACNESHKTMNNASEQVATDSTQVAIVYVCPMDCEKGKTYEKPGKCPVCGMDLQEKN